MAALTAERDTQRREDEYAQYLVAASTTIYKGAMCALNAAGNLVKFTAATGLKSVGIATETVDNSAGTAGAKSCTIRRGTFKMNNAATGSVVQGSLGANVYGADDNTVTVTATGASVAGVAVQLDTDGVWVRFP